MAVAIEFALAVFLIAVAVARWRRRAVAAWPSELRRARLVYAEHTFRAAGPPAIAARVDRAYRMASGTLVLVELKTRPAPRVYPADIIELSAQRLAAAADTGEPVADYAYVLPVSPDGRRSRWHRVRLLPTATVVILALRPPGNTLNARPGHRARPRQGGGRRPECPRPLALTADGTAFSDFLWRLVADTPIQNAWPAMADVPAKTPLSDAMSQALTKAGFKFVGSTICYAFMQPAGRGNDHLTSCFRHAEVQGRFR